MDQEIMVIAASLASYIAGWASNWWMMNRKSVLSKIENKLEDTIEDVTGLDVELSDAVEEIASATEEVVSDVADAVEDGASLEEIKDTIVESAQEEAFEMVEELSNMKVSELRDKLRDVGLPVDGKKAELVTRLAEYMTETE